MHIEGTHRCHAKEKLMNIDGKIYRLLIGKYITAIYRVHGSYVCLSYQKIVKEKEKRAV